jgi:hypothetical protein
MESKKKPRGLKDQLPTEEESVREAKLRKGRNKQKKRRQPIESIEDHDSNHDNQQHELSLIQPFAFHLQLP